MSGPQEIGIVGAGPVGLSCALRLAGFGIGSTILEAEAGLVPQGSKACTIQGDVVEVLDKVECGEQIAREGVTWHIARTYVRGKEIAKTVYPRPLGFGPFINISQYRIEQILLDRLLSSPLARVCWSHRVVGLSQDGDSVRVQVTTPEGTRELRFAYLVACDGVRSDIRQLTGVEWTGYTHSNRFFITDIKARLPLAHERHFHYDPPFNPGRQLVMHAQPDDVWRIDWQLPPDADISAERRTGALDHRIRDVIGDVPYEVKWMSTYHFYQRVVERMREGRVFFAGDAAHALPPFGARGMSSGIQDADNIAWKLALVLRGLADPALLDTYHLERHAAARENLRVTEQTMHFMVPPTRLRRWARSALLWLSRRWSAATGYVNSGRMAEPCVYTDSPIIEPQAGQPLVGRFGPDAPVIVEGNATRIRRLFGRDFVLLCFGESAGLSAARAAAACEDLPVRAVAVCAVDPPERPPGVTVVCDPDGTAHSSYGAVGPSWHLVRPDGYVAAAGAAGDLHRLPEVLQRCVLGLSAHQPLAREQ
jgi:3-(3-hydroxy-phenyl)propionate hydroxylase